MYKDRLSPQVIDRLYGCNFDNDLVVNTTKPDTLTGMVAWLKLAMQTHSCDVTCSVHALNYQEINRPCARQVAEHKAEWVWRQENGQHACSGTDSRFFMRIGDDWEAVYNLERTHSHLTPEETAKQYADVERLYVTPTTPDGKIHPHWQISDVFKNGSKHIFEQWIAMTSLPLPRQLAKNVFTQAVQSEEILKVSPKIRLIEAIRQEELALEIGFIPGDVVRRGDSIKPYMMEANDALLVLAERCIRDKMAYGLLYEGEL